MELPMLDDEEYLELHLLIVECMKPTQEFRVKHGLPLENLGLDERFQPALDLYERLTGYRETNARALGHHRISLYGPPCEECGRPLRTPNARGCINCGAEDGEVGEL